MLLLLCSLKNRPREGTVGFAKPFACDHERRLVDLTGIEPVTS